MMITAHPISSGSGWQAGLVCVMCAGEEGGVPQSAEGEGGQGNRREEASSKRAGKAYVYATACTVQHFIIYILSLVF